MKKYKFIEDLTSDVMFEAYGKDLKEVFENAAEALFTVICQTKKVKHNITKDIVIEAEDVRELMINWLQELIARVDIEHLFFSKTEIQEISETKLNAKVYGDKAKPELGETVVKAVTYYEFKFEKTDKGYVARVSLDI
ncbi:MAG: archease [Candidatus Aenigmatarchaeota archaeon]|nr:MAG: archease [Candidatus Aenigmarchaeota archaeon]